MTKIKLSTEQKRLYDRLKKSPLTSLQWCKETGSVKLSTRLSEIRSLGVNIKDKWLTLKSGKKIKSYSI